MLSSAVSVQKLFAGLIATSFVAMANPSSAAKPAGPARLEKKSEKKAVDKASQSSKETWTQKAAKGEELYVHMKTSMGDIVLKLFSKEAPKTVENFVGLATGEKKWTNPVTGKEESKPLYPGTRFHRVIPGFMIQGGDPRGDGTGNPGYFFEDELQSERKFDKPGLLGMAKLPQPNTNGSQFFITVEPTPHLDGKYTLFGEVVKGLDVVQSISKVPRDKSDRPNEEIRIMELKLSQTANPSTK